MGFRELNEEHKIRIALSRHARVIMADDINIFSTSDNKIKPASFINTIITNFHEDAKASLSTHLLQKRHEYETLFEDLKMNPVSIKAAVDHMVNKDKDSVIELLKSFMREKYDSKLYHINKSNIEYLLSDELKDEEFYNNMPGTYIKCLLEEYALLPFRQRARIFKKDVYEVVETACKLKLLLKVKTFINGNPKTFLVYPYRIVADPMNTQDYLACYSLEPGDSPKNKRRASFSMFRLEKPVMLKQKSFLSEEDKAKIEEDISLLSITYLLGAAEEIHVRLTSFGKQAYLTRLYARPEKNEALSTNDEYVFNCTPNQAYYYFLSYGPEAEILSPPSLRTRMMNTYKRSLALYNE